MKHTPKEHGIEQQLQEDIPKRKGELVKIRHYIKLKLKELLKK